MPTSKTQNKTKKTSVKTAQKSSNDVSLKKNKNIPDTIQGRRKFIIEQLSRYENKHFPCKALGKNVKVLVTEKSVTETAWQAAVSKNATKLALQLPEVIANASVIELNLPVKEGRQKDMHFVNLANLLSVIPRVGKAKLTVGYTMKGEWIEYAITDYEVIE